MTGQNDTFDQFKINQYKQWQKKLLILVALLVFLVLIMEFLVFFVLFTSEEKENLGIAYILKRIIIPSAINFTSLFTAILAVKSEKLSEEKKNLFVSLCIFTVCSVVAIFHNFFHVFLVAPAFAFFISSIFGDTKILKKLRLFALFVFPVVIVTFWFDQNTGNPMFKLLSVICSTIVVFFSYFYANSLVKSKSNQMQYIHDTYKNQITLIEELKIDSLTHLYNRTALNEALKRIIRTSHEKKTKPYLVMLDLDSLKAVNEKFGHVAGDTVLVRLAEIIKDNMGGARQVFRYGSEKIVLLFEDSMKVAVIHLVESIRVTFSQQIFDFSPENFYSLSAGISEYQETFDLNQWLSDAESALNYAKNHGKNQIKVSRDVQ